MKNTAYTHYGRSALYALVASVTSISMLFAAFFLLEPNIGHAVDSNEFYIRQTITDETSFLVQPSNVNMDTSITGVTGGTANGSTTFSVVSNNATGYTIDISFDYGGGNNEAMVGDTTSSETIRDYSGDVAGQPSYNWTASSAAQFAYTVDSVVDGDTDQSFRDNTTSCNQAAGTGNGDCWKAPDVGNYRIVDASDAAVTGATSTLFFRVVVPNGSVPAVTADTYTATATLTLVTQ